MTAVRSIPALTRDAFAKPLARYRCAWCGVATLREALELVEGDHVCPGCADEAHRESESSDEPCERCRGGGCSTCCGGGVPW